MQEIQQRIDDEIETGTTWEDKTFSALSKRWGNYCLEKYKGSLLSRGLEIAAALSNFDEEYCKR